MDAVSQENRRDVAFRILKAWGLSSDERAQLLDDQEQAKAVLSIYESLHVIFSEDKDRATEWPSKSNAAFGGASALEVMLVGDIEKVRSYLRYHMHNA